MERQSIWSLAVGIPALISVLRLWVEAGGDLQTTLLLVANVGPVNLLAALVVTAAWLVASALVVILALGRLCGAAPVPGPGRPPWYLWIGRWSAGTRGWVKLAAFGFAALTWQVLYLPLLVLAGCAAFDLRPSWRSGTRIAWLAAIIGYALLFGPVAVGAILNGYLLPAVLVLATPVLIALGATRPMPAQLAPAAARIAQVSAVVLFLAALAPVVVAPVLPLSVLTVGPQAAQGTQFLRGSVVEANDATTAILLEDGGVEFVRTASVQARVLCPDRGQTPRYRLWLYGVHVEDSLLQGIGRARRPVQVVAPRCRKTGPSREVTQG
jgi:hypothetical protein